MINNLPEDLFLHISDNFLNKGNQRLLNTCGLYSDNEKEQKNRDIKIAAYRIMLFHSLKTKQIKLFREIDKTLKNKFFLGLGGIIRFNNKCLLYAPQVQYGMCRFCEQQINKHPYNKMMNIYFELTTKE
tara:strand:- start:369 stop:755 length:387 start_codon:yes stop_codon:yes gene_type:complete